MTMYETLDAIADSYNPLMILLCLATVVFGLFKARYKESLIYFLGLATVFLIVYAIRFADNSYQIWKTVGLDYSTHTAVALNIVVFLILFGSRHLKILAIVSIAAYLLLMLYQGYHTAADVLSTILIVAPLILAVLLTAQKLATAKKPQPKKRF